MKQSFAGRRFGKLVALEMTQKLQDGNQLWKCQCDCGKEIIVRRCNLVSGRTKSCGCNKQTSSLPNLQKALVERRKALVGGTDLYKLEQGPRKDNTSGTVGVSYDKTTGVWKAVIWFRKKRYYLGSSTDKTKAIQLRTEAEQRLRGEFLEWYENKYKTAEVEVS